MTWEVIKADARELPLEDESVDLIITSPPYFALRSYRDEGEHYDGQIGSEDTPAEFVAALMECFTECRRVLKPSGSLWVNLGDKYAGTGGGNGQSGLTGEGIGADDDSDKRSMPRNNTRQTSASLARAKSLMGLPWRVAIAMIDSGWILRAEIIWSKPNGLPESVTDRVRRSHEQWFHFTKEPRYFSAVDELREPHETPTFTARQDGQERHARAMAEGEGHHRYDVRTNNPLGRLPGSVWTIPTEPLQVPDHLGIDHFAAFPQEWPRRIIMGWCPRGVCVECGEGRRPVVYRATTGKDNNPHGTHGTRDRARAPFGQKGSPGESWQEMKNNDPDRITGYACACPEPTANTTPAVVLDPFGGTGTTAGVAHMLGCHGISVDLSADYCRLAEWRIGESDHFQKTLKRTTNDRQGSLALGS